MSEPSTREKRWQRSVPRAPYLLAFAAPVVALFLVGVATSSPLLTFITFVGGFLQLVPWVSRAMVLVPERLPDVDPKTVQRWQIIHRNERTIVRLVTQRWRHDFETKDTKEAEAMLASLGIDPRTARVSSVSWRRPAPDVATVVTLLLASVAIYGALGLVSAPTWLAVALALAPLVALGARLVTTYADTLVGDDGVQLTDGLGRARFIAHREIARVDDRGHFLELALRSGEIVTLYPPRDALSTPEILRASVTRLAEEIRARAAPQPAFDLTVLARDGQSGRDWLASLKQLAKSAGFRAPAVPRDALWGVVESPEAPEDERVAAAVALRVAGLEDDERPRLRVAMDRCAHDALRDRLRVAIYAESDEELASALESERAQV